MTLNLVRLKLKSIDKKNLNSAIAVLLLVSLTWVSYFYRSSEFGLYYEDYWRVPIAMQWDKAELWNYLLRIPTAIVKTQEEGRPLHPGLINLFTVIGNAINGLSAMYFIAFLINAANVLLFYWLMRRSTRQPFFAITAALGFALFPVNTNHAWLTGAFGIAPALTLLLVALHLYLSDRQRDIKLSYLVIFITLFCYEKFFPLFWAAPLLRTDWKWSEKTKQGWVKHTGILLLLLLATAIARRLNGERRVVRLSAEDILQIFTEKMLMGPVVTIATFIWRPVDALLRFKTEWLIPLAFLLIAIAYCLHSFMLLNRRSTPIASSASRTRSTETKGISKVLVRLAIAGLIMLTLAYILTFTAGSVYITAGRLSLVHVAAIVGASILCGCVCCAIELIATRYQKRLLSTAVLSIFFTLLVAFGFAVQQDYAASRQYERAFWTDVSRLCPDMTKDTVILVGFNGLEIVGYMPPFRGRFTQVLARIYQFPEEWQNEDFRKTSVPRAYRLQRGWRDKVVVKDDRLRIADSIVLGRRDLPGEVKSSNIILLQEQDGRLIREADRVVLHGETLPLKRNDSTLEMPPYKPNVLYPYLIAPKTEKPIQYLFSAAP